MNALVEQTSFGVTTSSRTVAEVFEKDHRHVLRDIDLLLKRRPDLAGSKFGPCQIEVSAGGNGGKRLVRAFEMNRDGFTLVAFGFTGEEALDWKLAYIDAFNRMEAEIAGRAAREALENDGVPDQAILLPLHAITRGMAVVGEYRRIFGLAAARWMIVQLGLPTPPQEICGLLPALDGQAGLSIRVTPTTVSDWIEECTVREAEAKCASSALYANYLEWCAEAHRTAETQRVFGDALGRIGFGRYKAGSGNIWRRGIKLVD